MIKLGLHSNYWNGMVPDLEPYSVLRLMEECGAEAMDFPTGIALKMTPDERRKYLQAAENAGITLTMNGGMPGADVSHPDAEIRAAGVESCKKVMEAASDLHCRAWSGVICVPWLDMPAGHLSPEAKTNRWKHAVESLQKMCAYAEPLGVNICLELVNRFESYLVNNCADGLRLVNEAGCSNLKLLLDAFHMNIEEDSSVDALNAAMAAGKLGHVHICESNRRLPGLKKTDMAWDQILPAIKNGGYEGSIIVESMVLSSSPAAHSFFTWRDMTAEPTLENMIREAKTSLDFVRSFL